MVTFGVLGAGYVFASSVLIVSRITGVRLSARPASSVELGVDDSPRTNPDVALRTYINVSGSIGVSASTIRETPVTFSLNTPEGRSWLEAQRAMAE
jgi:hypothetical protein